MSASTAPAVRHGVPISTTDATPTVAATLQTEKDKVYHIYARVVGIETVDHDEAAAYSRYAAFKNDGGTLTQLGSTATPFTAEDTAGWDVGFSVSGTKIQCSVTGAAATTIRWLVDLDVLEVT